MTLHADEAARVMVEVATYQEPKREDTPEEAAFRAKFKVEFEIYRKKGWIVEWTPEVPE